MPGRDVLLACALGLFVLQSAGAETVILQQGRDGYSGAADTSIYQDTSANSSGAFPYLYAGITQFSYKRRALLKFDLSGKIPSGAQVTSVSLQLYVERARVGNHGTAAHRINRTWNEGINTMPPGTDGGTGAAAATGDATWSHASYSSIEWATPGGDFTATPSGTGTVSDAGSIATIAGTGMAADVNSWEIDPASNYGWILLVSENTTWNAKRFLSSEAATGERPMLLIDFTPVSAAVDGWELYQ